MPDHAGKVDGAAPINEQLRTAHDLRVGFWKQQRCVHSIYYCIYKKLMKIKKNGSLNSKFYFCFERMFAFHFRRKASDIQLRSPEC